MHYRETLTGAAARNQENARLVAEVAASKDPLKTGANVVQGLFRDLARQTSTINTMNSHGSIKNNDFEGAWYTAAWNPESGEISITPEWKPDLSEEDVQKRIISSAAPLSASIMLGLIENVKEYRDPERIGETINAINKLEEIHSVVAGIGLEVLKHKRGSQLRSIFDESIACAWDIDGELERDKIKAALTWYRERERVTEAVAAEMEKSTEADPSSTEVALTVLAQDLYKDRIFPRNFSTNDGKSLRAWTIIDHDPDMGYLVIAEDGEVGSIFNIHESQPILPINNAALLSKAGLIADTLLSRSIRSVLPNLGKPESSEA